MSVTDQLREGLVHALENVARDVSMTKKHTDGLERLQDIMTEAKEKVSV